MVAPFTAKTTNLEKSDLLFVTYVLIIELKSHMLFTWKSFTFSDFARKKFLAPGNGGGYAPPPLPPFSTTLFQYLILVSLR